MTDTRSRTKSLLGLPVSPPPLNGGGVSEPLVTAQEGYARRAAREKEFVERVVIHSERLLAYARWELQSEADAEETVQDVMDQAWKIDVVAKCGGDDRRIKAYMLTAIRNRVKNEFRRRDRARALEIKVTAFQRSRTNDTVPPLEDAAERELNEARDHALEELSWRHQEAYTLVCIDDVELEVAALSLGMSVPALRVYLMEATRHVRNRLAPNYAPNAAGRRVKEDTP
ncbi:MAG TPA: sigma-70 family RNA polymerase sigma factor [Gemmatimonadaceae bacterium]|jgi:RNA polymerase sigma factor (sigma-70 family)